MLEPSTEEVEADPAHDDRLSTIEEVSHETDSSLSAMMNEFAQNHMPPGCDEEWWLQLSPAIQLGCYEASTLPSTVEEAPLLTGMPYMGWGQKVAAAPLMHYLTFGACTPAAKDLLAYDELGNAYLEM